MAKFRVLTEAPPMARGDAENQLMELRDYLTRLTEELEFLLTHLEADNIDDTTFQRIRQMIPDAYTGLPPMDGEVTGGSANAWARGDHRHPTDTSRAAADDLSAHVADTANPHGVTKTQVGLSDVANERQYSALNPPPTPSASDVGAIPATEKGSAGGVAELDANGMVPSVQLPSYVDDVLECASMSAFPATGESGKIYVALDTNKTYRWSGSAYVEISESLALGETSSTAYRGDRGKTAYDHSQVTSGNPHNVTAAEVGLGNVDNVQQYSALNPPPLPTPADIGAATAQDLTDHVGDTNNPHGVTAAQAGARPDTWMPTAADVGARADTWMPTAADVGARPDTWTPSAADVGAQATITASGMLKGDGLGGVSAATAGADYQAPLTAGVDYQTPLVAGTDYQTPLVAGTDYATPGMIPAVHDPSDATPQNLGTAAAGSSGDYSRADHVHEKPTYTASDVGLGNVDNVQQYSVNNPPPVPDAEDIPYDNTTSGLSATDLQAAVDELAQGGSAAASAVSYDNTGSGLLATDVQDAIDELANGGGGSTPAASVIPYNNTGSGLTASNVQDAIDEVLGDIPSSPSDIGAQAGITASGLLKGDGAGNISAAVSGTDYQAPLTAGTDYQTPLVAGTDYQTPLVAGTDYQTPLTAGTDYQTPLVEGTDYQTPLVAGTDYQTPLAAGTDYATPGMIPSVPSPSNSTPQALGTAAAGSSGDYSRADHVHQKPSYSKSDVGLGNVDNVQQYSASNPPPYPVTSVNGSTGAVTVSVPSAYTSDPEMDGTASPGSSGAWAKGDHVHPSDTSKANQAQLATVETGSTASKAYSVGNFFCWNGLLYRVTAAISSGASFTPGTNCEATTATDIIQGVDISSEITPSTGATINRAVAIGKLVAINLTTPKITTANSDIQVGTISQGYRPLSGTSWSGNLRFATTSDFGYGHVSVHGNGNIYVTYSKTTSYGLYASVVYYVH